MCHVFAAKRLRPGHKLIDDCRLPIDASLTAQSLRSASKKGMQLSKTLKAAIVVLLIVAAAPVWAQKTELAVGVGGYFPVNLTGVGNAVAVEGTFATQLVSVPLVAA